MRKLRRKAVLVDQLSEGVVEHVVSVFGNLDAGGDVVHPGSFLKTISENGPAGADRIRATWQHDIWEPIGRPLEMEEVRRADLPAEILGRAPDATGGLRVVTQLSMTQRGRDAYTLLADGVINEWSIGYYPVKWDWDDAGELRNLREVKLVEYALVTLAMNPAAMTSAVKAVVDYQDLPLGDEEAAWDGDAAEGRVRAWAGGGEDLEGMDWERYRSAFVLWDEENAEQVGGYKLLIADVVDGELTAMPRGIFAAAVALQGGRAPVREFDDGDVEGAKRHLSRYYEKLERTAPWDREEASALDWLVEGVLSQGRRGVGADDFVGNLVRLGAPGVGGAWLDQLEVSAQAWATQARALKEGRVLSSQNAALVSDAIVQMQEAVAALQELLEAAKPPDEERALTVTREILARRIELAMSDLM